MLTFIKMKKNIKRKVKVPEGVSVHLDNGLVTISSGGKKVSKKMEIHGIELIKEGNEIVISAKNGTKRESKIIGTIWAHLNNMINGLEKDYVYKLEICNVHFPMNVKIEGNKVLIKSFLGEVIPRVSNILPGVKVEIKGTEIIVSSLDVEAAGQTAANLEKATKVTNRDRRVFQDGIFIKEKPGREI